MYKNKKISDWTPSDFKKFVKDCNDHYFDTLLCSDVYEHIYCKNIKFGVLVDEIYCYDGLFLIVKIDNEYYQMCRNVNHVDKVIWFSLPDKVKPVKTARNTTEWVVVG